MALPCKDYDFIADRYVNVKHADADVEIMWYERDIDSAKTPTECLICIEAENEMYTKYAHPKAHLEAQTNATIIAESLAIKETSTAEYIDYYIFFYGKEYKKMYKGLLKKYKEEYSKIVLGRTYNENDKVCQHHLESIQYHYHDCGSITKGD
jgi:hypothetical protein